MKYKSAGELQKKIDEYFDYLKSTRVEQTNEKTGIKTVSREPAYYGALLLHLGESYDTVRPYEAGEHDTARNPYSAVLARGRMRCEQDLVLGAALGMYDGRTVLAALGKHHEYAEKREITGAGGGPVEFKGALEEWSR